MRAGRLVLLFLCLCLLYHSNLRPVASGDSLPSSLIPFTLWLDGSVRLDRFGPWSETHIEYGPSVLRHVGEHWYSFYPVGGPVLAAPLYLPLAVVPWVRRQPPGTLIAVARIAEKLVAVVLSAAAVVALFVLMQRLVSGPQAWILSIVFAVGTGNWSTSSQALWQHTYGVLPIIGCLWAVDRWSESARWQWMAGLCAGMALSIRPTNVAVALALAAALWSARPDQRAYVRVLSPIGLAGIVTLAYNISVFGRAAGDYPTSAAGHWLDGLAGILLSPGRGLLFYTPVAIFAVAAFAPCATASRAAHKPLLVAASGFVLADVILTAWWPIWWGGYCWGPRLLTDILPAVMVLIAIGSASIDTRRFRWAFAGAAVYGCLVQAVGVYCYPKGHWDASPMSVNEAPQRLWDWADNPIARTSRGGLVWEPYAIVWQGLKSGPAAASDKLRELGINAF